MYVHTGVHYRTPLDKPFKGRFYSPFSSQKIFMHLIEVPAINWKYFFIYQVFEVSCFDNCNAKKASLNPESDCRYDVDHSTVNMGCPSVTECIWVTDTIGGVAIERLMCSAD